MSFNISLWFNMVLVSTNNINITHYKMHTDSFQNF